MITLSTAFDYANVLYNQTNKVNLLVSAKAPEVELNSRPPLNIVVVIDNSGSMGWYGKMDQAKKSLMKLIDHLTSQDRLGIVSFNWAVNIIAQPAFMDTKNKAELKEKVAKLKPYGGTDFNSGMLKGLKLAGQIDGVTSLLMFTDGAPTVGVTEADKILANLKAKKLGHIKVSGYGYGKDVQAKLLDDLANIGKGNYSYIASPDDCLTAFAQELGGLLSCVGQNVRFKLTPKFNTKILRVRSDVDVDEIDDSIVVSLPDIYSEDTKHCVIELELPKQTEAFPRPSNVASIVFKYTNESGDEISQDLTGKVSFVRENAVDKKPNQTVMDQIALLQLYEAQLAAEKLANAGNFRAAQDTMEKTRGIVVNDCFVSEDVKLYTNAVTDSSQEFFNSTAYDANEARASASDFKKG